MLFVNEDPLPVYAVACAAEHLLRDLAEHSENSPLHKTIKNMIKPGKEKEFWKASNKSANFLKHADRDPKGILELEETEIDVTIALTCGYWNDLGYQPSLQMRGFMAWFAAMYPELIVKDSLVAKHLAKLNLPLLRELPRPEQLQWGKQLCEMITENSLASEAR